MTETDWLAAIEPGPMLETLRGQASDRKLRLFACAYARTGSWLQRFGEICFEQFYEGWGRQRPLIDPEAALKELLALRRAPEEMTTACHFEGQPPRAEEGEHIVTLAERYAEGLVDYTELGVLREELSPRRDDARLGAAYCGPSAFRPSEEYNMLLATLAPSGQSAAEQHTFVAIADSGPRRRMNPEFREPVVQQTLLLQAELLREIFGNAIRFPALEPGWRTSNVLGMARSIDESRDFSIFPILGDALMDAGCDDNQLLSHCRVQRPHVRGCWLLDLILGRS